jgi:hypothetical protein
MMATLTCFARSIGIRMPTVIARFVAAAGHLSGLAVAAAEPHPHEARARARARGWLAD